MGHRIGRQALTGKHPKFVRRPSKSGEDNDVLRGGWTELPINNMGNDP